MKKRFLSQLLVSTICFSSFAPIDSEKYYSLSDGKLIADTVGKWSVKANSTLKGASGRLLFDNPKGSTWIIYIYAMADEKYINSFANVNNNGSIVVSEGTYKITINNVPVLNVPIKRGHDTRLKCGTLNVVSQSYWDISDSTGKTFYTSSNGPYKMPVPIGTYSFNLGGQKHMVVIEEGKTVEM